MGSSKHPDWDKMEANLDKVSRWLEKLEVSHTRTSISLDDGYDIPILLTTYTVSPSNKFLVMIGGDGTWIRIKTLVAEKSQLPEYLLQEIYYHCLLGNFILDEVTFSADRKGNIFIEADMLASTRFEDFKEEFFSIATGIHYFLDFMKKFGQQSLDTSSTKLRDIQYQ